MSKLIPSDFFRTPEEFDKLLMELKTCEVVGVEDNVLTIRRYPRIVQPSNYYAMFLGKSEIIRTIDLKNKKKYKHH